MDVHHCMPYGGKILLKSQTDKLMSVMLLLIGCSLTVAIGFLVAFVWNTKQGQFDDMHTPSVRMLFEDETKEKDN
ncbi:MAG: hypothetical protein RIQ62_883 [Bacteroidota bacterium]|jgi:cbb3-type cytochrome oxidase maturation protein